uniref:glyceraldehyde-3-phosphate dehydrogenase (NADP(+)) (phosphorylating) n=1 Tax=Physcomitrium patens TaxID=3218 RepID=A0A7I4A5A0_PHYPA
MAATAFTAVSVPSNASLKVAGSKGLSEFSGMKSTNAVTFGKRSDDLASIVAAQSAVSASSGATRAVTEAKIKVAINGFGRIGRNFIRCWQGRKDSPLDVVVIKGTMTTTHSYTGDQRLLDASHRDLRRARAAALNIVPTSTGAAKAVALVLPNLKGKINGIALRVPTPNVSVVDLVVQVEKKTFAEEVNQAFRDACQTEQLKGVLAVCDEPLVSVDFRCTDVSSTVDSSLTMVMGDDMVKVVAWYDNEWGYSQRVVDLANLVAEKWE